MLGTFLLDYGKKNHFGNILSQTPKSDLAEEATDFKKLQENLIHKWKKCQSAKKYKPPPTNFFQGFSKGFMNRVHEHSRMF